MVGARILLVEVLHEARSLLDGIWRRHEKVRNGESLPQIRLPHRSEQLLFRPLAELIQHR